MKFAAFMLVAALGAAVIASQDSPAALRDMVETERAFARRAGEIPVRQAFVEFFADESIAFDPDPRPARESLRQQTRTQPAGFQLLWEPRFGDISASGDLGYLTGPSETIVPGQPPRYGNYFSVWKRQADGQYRVILDVGGRTPGKPTYADGFTRARAVGAWRGSESKAASEASLLAADKSLSAAIASAGAARAYLDMMHSDGRFQREGFQPMTTKQAAADWLSAHVKAWSTEPIKSETAAAADLGYTWGKYNVTPADRGPYSGYYVHVWTRKADGTWQLVAETVTPPPR